ncbi:MAG: hypothetical protein EPO24_03985 [Bacteroidetes bacterium]|nr:MAG: hypothetical protein EPO24_03985 [Bacteroidota bacterium]
MTKHKLYIIVSKDFHTMGEATEFLELLVAGDCGFHPIIKKVSNVFIVCRAYRLNDPDDKALYLCSDSELEDGEPLASWIHVEEPV